MGSRVLAVPVPVTDREVSIACRMVVFSETELAHEVELLQEHLASILEVRERADGYSSGYPADRALFARMAELVGLEHRCCPFLDFQLEWKGTEESPSLHVTGSRDAKSFLSETFVRLRLK